MSLENSKKKEGVQSQVIGEIDKNGAVSIKIVAIY